MSNSLYDLFQTLASASNEDEVKFRLMDRNIGEYFGAQDWGLYLYDSQFRLASVDICGIKNVDEFLERFQEATRDNDPLFSYVLEYHAPVHEEMILPQGGWKQTKIYQNVCAYYNHEHIAIAPIVGEGHLIGTIYFARAENIPAFNNQDLANLSSISAHLSATIAKLRSQQASSNSSLANCLTTRELQIADLVAQGLTNAEIGIQLWISRNTVKQTLKNIFRKLDVSARAQMVAKLRGIVR